jgi:hypothetical protein
MGALARLAEQELGAPRDDLSRKLDEGADEILEVEGLGPAAVQGHHVGPETRLQRGEAVELVQHHIGHGVALDLDHDAHAVAVGLVAQLRDALDLLLAHELADALDQRGLVHLVGDLGEDDRLALLAHLLDRGFAPHDDRAAARSCRRSARPRGRGSRRRSGSPGPGTIAIRSSIEIAGSSI